MSSLPDSEIRFNAQAELREADGAPTKIVGYAAVFNSESIDLGGFREVILPGAFRTALASTGDILALMHHDPKMILGRRSRGTLELREDERGLLVEITPPNTSVGRDAVENVRRGDISGMSFFFRKPKDEWKREAGGIRRTIREFGEIREVTLTGIPAYHATSAEVRDALAAMNVPPYDRTEYLRRRLALAAMT